MPRARRAWDQKQNFANDQAEGGGERPECSWGRTAAAAAERPIETLPAGVGVSTRASSAVPIQEAFPLCAQSQNEP